MHFSENLTCIIGARGTCKSTAVELIRFALGIDPDRIRSLLVPQAAGAQNPTYAGLLNAALAGGTVRCDAVLDNGDDVQIERTMDGEPRVLKDGVEVSAVNPGAAGVEVYSQGELQQVVENPAKRLALVDRAHRSELDAIIAQRSQSIQELRDIGPRLRRLRSEVDTLEQRLRLLPKHREDLMQLTSGRPEVPAEIEVEREKAGLRRRRCEAIDELQSARDEVERSLKDVAGRRTRVMDLFAYLAGDPALSSFLKQMEPLSAAIEAAVQAAAALSTCDATSELAEVRAADAAHDERYRVLREQQKEQAASLRAEDTLRQEIESLMSVELKRSELIAQRDELLAQRKKLRDEIGRMADQVYDLRVGQIEQINQEFFGVVALTLQQGSSSSVHRTAVERLLEGSRLRNQIDVARDLSDRVPAADLVDIVEAGDTQRIATLLGRDASQMARLISHLADKQELYDLEGTSLEDWLEITLYVDGVPKPLSQLSKGQMATALLPLILREGTGPVVFDQPEDDLDNAFIFKILVPRICSLKRQRQLIFVTHNANIPVLGDAEQVNVMSMSSADRASAVATGSVDDMREHILQLLEGGADAFQRRGDKYAELLPSRLER